MKIKQIRIANFGRLSDYELDPKNGITTVIEDNGWGKSTLAAFIKTMFYGFAGEKKHSVAENERKHYTPWTGGAFGGSIVFEINGKEYRLTRLFGSKAEEDSFELYDNKTMLKSTDYSENIGEEIFNLDAESFRRTIFISQNDIQTGATDAISAKLGNLGGATDDINNYEQVSKKFKDKLNALSSTRATGLIRKKRDEITGLENQLKADQGTSVTLEEKTALRDEQKKRHQENRAFAGELGKRLEAASKREALKTKREQYYDVCERLKKREQAMERAASAFPMGVPTDEQFKEQQEALKELAQAELYIASRKPSQDDLDTRDRLMPVFIDNLPAESELAQYTALSAQLSKKQEQLSGLQFSEEEKNDYKVLGAKYKGKAGISEKADALIEQYTEAKTKNAAIPELEEKLKALQLSKGEREPQVWLGFMIFGIMALLAGLAIYIFGGDKGSFMGTALTSGGLTCTMAGLVFKFSTKPSAEASSKRHQIDAVKKELDAHKSYIFKTEDQLRDFFTACGYECDFEHCINILSDIKAEFRRYLALVEKDRVKRDDRLTAEINEDKKALNEFLAPFEKLFSMDQDYSSKLNTLNYEAERYTSVLTMERRYKKLRGAFIEKQKDVEQFLTDFGFSCKEDRLGQSFERLREKYDIYKQTVIEVERAEEEKKHFEDTNDMNLLMNLRESDNQESMAQVQEKLTELSRADEVILENINVYNNQIASLLEEKDRLREAEERLTTLREESAVLSKREELIKAAASLMDEAKSNFTSKYSIPVAEAFRKYYNLVEGRGGNKFSFDANMNLLIDDCGSYKDLSYYSAGGQDKINLCFRMALVEAMYKQEKPVVVMDDPFINLDEKRFDGARELLKALSSEYQILYLTCHESRDPQ